MASPEPYIDVETLLSAVRSAAASFDGADAVAAEPQPPAEWEESALLLEQAQRVADVGTRVPPFVGFGPLRRRLARLVTRGLYVVLQVISVDQRVFNNLMLTGMRRLLEGVEQQHSRLHRRLAGIEAMVSRTATQLSAVRDVGEHIGELNTALTAQVRTLRESAALLDGLQRRVALLQSEVAAHTRRLTGAPRPAAATDAAPEPQWPASLYAGFEAQFRGSREEIKTRQRVYLPIVQAAVSAAPNPTIFDLGCGRGEWLELLAETGLQATGIEVNATFLDECRRRGLSVVEADALSGLRQRATGSCAVITAFHLIEHLAPATVVELLDEALRVLTPGGVVIIETPNPDNLRVGASLFYLDPTHRRPIPSALAEFLFVTRGFVHIEVLPLHPGPEPLVGDGMLAEQLNRYLCGPQDYAIIGRKP